MSAGGGETRAARLARATWAQVAAEERALSHLAAAVGGTRHERRGAWASLSTIDRLFAAGEIAKTGIYYHLPGADLSALRLECKRQGCGARFLPDRPNQRTCSEGCRKAHRSARHEIRTRRGASRWTPADLAPQKAPKKIARYERPRTRGECSPGGRLHMRPCPFAGCRHHLLLDFHASSGRMLLAHGTDDPLNLSESCSLDVAERGEHIEEEVAILMGKTRQTAATTIHVAESRLRASAADFRPDTAPTRPDLHWGNGEEPGPDQCQK